MLIPPVDKIQSAHPVDSDLYVGALEDLQEIPAAGNAYFPLLYLDIKFGNT